MACQRRGVPCFGQEFVDVPLSDPADEQTIVERLKRAETILDSISRDVKSDGSSRGERTGGESPVGNVYTVEAGMEVCYPL